MLTNRDKLDYKSTHKLGLSEKDPTTFENLLRFKMTTLRKSLSRPKNQIFYTIHATLQYTSFNRSQFCPISRLQDRITVHQPVFCRQTNLFVTLSYIPLFLVLRRRQKCPFVGPSPKKFPNRLIHKKLAEENESLSCSHFLMLLIRSSFPFLNFCFRITVKNVCFTTFLVGEESRVFLIIKAIWQICLSRSLAFFGTAFFS